MCLQFEQKEADVMNIKKRKVIVLVGALCAISSVWAEEGSNSPALAKAVAGTSVTLQQGLTAIASEGKPISAKYEIDEGAFQLSVYTEKAGKFSEVVIDHTTGKVAKSEAITSGDDLKEAKEQSKAMAAVKGTLKAAVDQAEHASPGFRAVSVEPETKGGHTVAEITLVKGSQFKSVSEPLE
jgi:uncharacterized membrane protein YkoI